MKDEAADAVLDLKTVYGEVFPHANPENARFTETQIAQVVLFRRELARMEERLTKRITVAVRSNRFDQE